MKVYVAGSTAEIDRAKFWTSRLQRCGVEVISTWIEVVQLEGANPRGATLDQRRRWVHDDLDQVRRADLFWLLAPTIDRPSRGAWVELGVAAAEITRIGVELTRIVIASGDTQQSIYGALAHAEYEEDVDAFIEIISRART